MPSLTPDLVALLGIFGVHLIPKFLQRASIPAPVTALTLGMVASVFAPNLHEDPTLSLLSTLGISALFLFAGLGVDAEELGARPKLLITTLVVHALLLSGIALVGAFGLGLDVKAAMLFGLAIGTPSGGFILDGLSGLGATEGERRAIHDSALICELLSLVVFFFVMQSETVTSLVTGSLAIALLLVLVPIVLRGLARAILPYAPNAEFTLIVLTAIGCAYATRKLGIYYLLGAFAVGIVARRLEDEVPELAAQKNMQAIELFAAFFSPFYFARAGLEIDGTSLDGKALALALVLLVVGVPVRIGLVLLARRITAGETNRAATRIGAALIPTFVFSLVMAQMLHPTSAPRWIAGGLVLFAILNAFVPQTVFRIIPPNAEVGPEAGAGTEAGAGAETGTGTGTETEAEAEAGAEPGTEAGAGAGAGTEPGTETASPGPA